MKLISHFQLPIKFILSVVCLALWPSAAFGDGPDFTAAGVIAALKGSETYSSSPYRHTFNLGATGMRGWIYDGVNRSDANVLGLSTDLSRQILVTTVGVGTPADGILATDDVILGVAWGNGVTAVVPFSSDARKTFGLALVEAEKDVNNGYLKIKRWRPSTNTTSDVLIKLGVMGSYTATAPYTCPKSNLILANARTRLVNDLIADPDFLSISGYRFMGAVKGLALLASVESGNANYDTVRSRLQDYAHALTPADLTLTGCDTWNWAYVNIFLSEYYLQTREVGPGDAQVLVGINKYTLAMAKAQSRYGTFSHGGSGLKADGSLHGSITPYGPVNCAGNAANLSIVLGKKALEAGAVSPNFEINDAITRSNNFLAYYVNKGVIPYGEHEPAVDSHSLNGKDQMCAMIFSLQDNRQPETEYFSRIATAAYNGREEGHTGTGFNYMWEAIGANVAGQTAVAKYLEKIRWNLDLQRRTDGSFVYDGSQTAADLGSSTLAVGSNGAGSYLGLSQWQNMNPTANYILNYSLPLKRLYITGKNAKVANTLDVTKVDNAIAAGSYQLDCVTYSNLHLIDDLKEYDPVVREAAAVELAARVLTQPLTPAQVSSLIASITNDTLSNDANQRMGACTVLGLLKESNALTALGQRVSDTDLWVRAKAAKALAKIGTPSNNQLNTLLSAYATNATDPEIIRWEDPLQLANGFLSITLFDTLPTYSIAAAKGLLYPAMKAGLKQPDSRTRNTVAAFAYNYLTYEDLKSLAPDVIQCVTSTGQANTMFSMYPRGSAIDLLAKYKIAEAVPLSLDALAIPEGYGWNANNFQTPALNALALYGDSARWTLPALRSYIPSWSSGYALYGNLISTIATLEAAITTPAGITNLLPVGTPQLVSTTGPKAITVAGTSCRGGPFGYVYDRLPANGSLSGTLPYVIYTPNTGFTGPDSFTFRIFDTVTSSKPATVSIIVGTPGTGLRGEYFDNMDFTLPRISRTDPGVDFDWGTGSPDGSVGPDTFSVRWSGQLLVPETGSYTFSTLNSDGARLYVNGVQVLADFVDHLTRWNDGVAVSLVAGQKVELLMEYYENSGSAVAKLKWTGPSLARDNGLPIAKEWLYDGIGMTNRTAYAHPQSFTIAKNTSQAITLKGSGASSTAALAYTVSAPVNGSFNGTTAPNLIFTPNAGFTGVGSFTYTVNNGTGSGDSAPATVLIEVLGGIPAAYYWTDAVTGNWSDTTRWTNSSGASFVPVSGGQVYYSMNFNKAGSYITTQNYGGTFLFNQLNATASVTVAGTNSLTASANGLLLPQVNLNSSNNVAISSPLELAASTTLNGSGNLNLSNIISGAGGLIKNGSGVVMVSNASNTYSGGTIINGGRVEVDLQASQGLGSGMVTIAQGATLQLNRINSSNPVTLNGGTIFAVNGWGNSIGGAITLNSVSTINVQDGFFTLSGLISGSGGFTKTGLNTLSLTGANTFSGANRVTAGTLHCTNASALGSGLLDISSGAKVHLVTGNRTIKGLTFNGGGLMPAGTYGSSISAATYKDDTYFAGSGFVTVQTPNFSPIAAAQSVDLPEDSIRTITLAASDAEGNGLAYSIVSPPSHSVSYGISGATMTYKPVANYYGTDSFTFKANDGNSDSAVVTVSITVTSVNDSPVVTPQSVTTAEDTAIVIVLPASDLEGDALTYWAGNNTNGTFSGSPPNITFNPTANFNGTASFEYSVSDGISVSPNAKVFINVTPVNDAPVATAQNVSAVVGSSSAITLAGTDVDGNSLIYSIVSQPTRGTVTPLTGSRNVTYTPTGTNVGTDSFTFKVNDGTTDSATATVSISVTNSTFTWNTASNNWSNAASWTSGAPGAAGQAAYVLNFNMAGSYTATNDLNSGFLLNRINFGSNVTLAGNRLALSVSGSTAPQLIQNSANLVTVANNLELNATTTLSGTNSGAMNLSGNVFGAGGLVKSCTGDVYLNGTNSYTGGTTITAGMLHLGLQKNSALGSGIVTLNPGTTLVLNRVGVVNSLSLNSATLMATNGFGDGWSGPISLSGTSIMDLQTTGNLTLSGVISGLGGLTKIGNSTTLTLSGISNSYSGTTTVSAGTLACTNATALGKGALALASAAKLNLAFNGVTQAATLSLGGTAQANGTYGSTTSSATNKNDTWFSGSGVLNVGPVPSVPFTWNTASSNTWSTVGSWTSGNPVAAGQSNYALNFNVAGGYTATHNLNAGFLVNQLNFGGSAVTLAGNSLALTANVSAAPQLNQNSTSSVTVSNNLALNTTTVLGGTSSGAMTLTGMISGAGGLIKNCSGDVALNGINTYSGGTTVNAGSLYIGLQKNSALGSGPVTLNTGSVLWLNRVSIANSLTLNSSTLYATNGFGDAWTGPITLSGTSAINLQTTGNLTLSGVIGGSGGMTKVGNSTTLTLSGASNTYTGTTIISGGMIACTNVGALGQGSLEVATGAKLNLAFNGTGQVSSLSLGGTSQPSGTYGSTASSATNKNDTYFSGTGVINVATVFNARMASAPSAPANSAPVFTANPTVMAGASESFAYTGQSLAGKATDPDVGDILTYSKISGPAWLAVATSGALSGTPPSGSVGLNTFIVRVTDSALATADAGLRITVTALPAPWMIGSIGGGMVAGSTSYSVGTFSQSGSGTLGTTSDKLSFSSQTLTGDGEIIAKISALQDTGNLSGVGVMIRESLAANSTFVFMGMTGSNTYLTASRDTTGGISTKGTVGTGPVPNTWVRLIRVGNVITGYKSIDGTTWSSTGSTTVTMSSSCYIGLAVSSGSDTTLNSSKFSNLSVTP